MYQPKLKLFDSKELSLELFDMYQEASHEDAINYALSLIDEMILMCDFKDMKIFEDGKALVQAYLSSIASIKDVRQYSFHLHGLARLEQDRMKAICYRMIGHAIATAHVKAHALVVSDYMIRFINLKYPDDISKVEVMRLRQIDLLKTQLRKGKRAL